MTMTQEEYNIIESLSTAEWKMMMAELSEEQVKDYWLIKMLMDDHTAALNA